MTYRFFLFVFVLVPIAILLVALRGRVRPYGRAMGIVLLVAFLYTAPWDNWCVGRGIWEFPPSRVLFRVRHLPVEECAFFLLQTVLTGLLTIHLLRRAQPRKDSNL